MKARRLTYREFVMWYGGNFLDYLETYWKRQSWIAAFALVGIMVMVIGYIGLTV